MNHGGPVTELPAVGNAAQAAGEQAGLSLEKIDVYEPYAPFPHIEAIIVEEFGLVPRGAGVDACLDGRTAPDGEFPISPSGGCLGRGHPPLVTPLINHVEAVRQLRGIASTQVPGAQSAITTAEHGHVNGATSTIFRAGA
jgi:acetyl-CoA C-acetyltransferase